MRVGYSRISDEKQAVKTDPLAAAEQELRKAGAELILVETGSGKDDTARPKFRQLRELVLDGKASEVITPSQDRLGRNLELVLKFCQLCQMQGVPIRDLNGRELEIKTADGRLMTTIIGALDQHRSDLYGEKTARHLQAARDQGFPARPHLPYGLQKVRNDAGRFIAIDLHPVDAPLARQRVDWFMAGASLEDTCRKVKTEQGLDLDRRALSRWLINPLLTGRLAWHKRGGGDTFDHVEAKPSFPALITDAEAAAIRIRLENGRTRRAVRNRKRRMLSGLITCQDCKKKLCYHLSSPNCQYLRCMTPGCDRRLKRINVDQVFGVLQYALSEHAKALVPVLQRPASDPPEVLVLEGEIRLLQTIPGTESVIESKRAEINRIRNLDTETPAWLLIGVLRSLKFWYQEDEHLNDQLRTLLESVTVRLGDVVAESAVVSVRCRTAPAEAPLPEDQRKIVMKRGLVDLLLTVEQEGRVEAALKLFS